MTPKLTLIAFIFLCLMVGVSLTLLPWLRFFGGDWGENFLLAYLSNKASLPILHTTIASGWFRGIVTGIGLLNLAIAFWEMANFSKNVKQLDGEMRDVPKTSNLSNHEGQR